MVEEHSHFLAVMEDHGHLVVPEENGRLVVPEENGCPAVEYNKNDITKYFYCRLNIYQCTYDNGREL